MLKYLLKIRISLLATILLAAFLIIITFSMRQVLTPGQLALFSVNSFLYGYYFSPLLSAQKARVSSLQKTVHEEATTILDILTQSHLVSQAARHKLKVKLKVYLHSVISDPKVNADNPYYDELLYFTKEKVKKEDAAVMDVIYGRVSKTQQNRDTLNGLFATKLYSHEWLVVGVLFFITLYFALQTDYGDSLFFGLMLAVLCTGLSLLMVILAKYATLTHKQAISMWDPLKKLDQDHFDDVTADEFRVEKASIDARQKKAK